MRRQHQTPNLPNVAQLVTDTTNTLYYGDNLTVMREHIPDASVDLIYLDPPFNSQKSYNIIFKQGDGEAGTAQAHAFDDTWHWGHEAARTFDKLVHGDSQEMAELAIALRAMVGESDMLAYLVMMAPRLVELRRVLKPTGTLYLHCDPTSSHYLKMLLDAVFGPRNFRNEVVWERSTAKNDPRRWGRNHDILLMYAAGAKATWNPQYGPLRPGSIERSYRHIEEGTGRRFRLGDLTANKPGGDVDYVWHGATPYKGRHWAYSKANMDQMLAEGRIVFNKNGMPRFKGYLDEQSGSPIQDVWTDIKLSTGSKERIGYPTQKPLALLERIIAASSNPGDVILDPFCGCGTAVDAAQRLGRRWIGIDISYLAIDVIDTRLRAQHGDTIAHTYVIRGKPVDIEGARALAKRDKFEFERWAVSLVDATPNNKRSGDKGIDGVARFTTGKNTYGRILISVKGGANNPGFVRDLGGTVQGHKAAMGIMVSLKPPTKGMKEAAASLGVYTHPLTGRTYPRVQVITVEELLAGARPERPPTLMPYVSTDKLVEDRHTDTPHKQALPTTTQERQAHTA